MKARPSKDLIYAQFARIAKALGSAKRLEVLDLLAQAPRHVEALAIETGMSVASVSQHLQVLRHAGLVECERQGTKMEYQLADESVLRLWLDLRSVAESRLAELTVAFGVLKGDRAREEAISPETARTLLRGGEACLVDVRPLIEYQNGHAPGAQPIPIDELPYRTDDLPRDRLIIAYSRGKYCLLADKAVAILRLRGFRALRLNDGWAEWKVERRGGFGIAAMQLAGANRIIRSEGKGVRARVTRPSDSYSSRNTHR
jgi:DNA-binding transcriptional ArsR family regulator